MLWFLLLLFVPEIASSSRKNCGGNFTARRGILQTPNFPKKFTTPIDCEWIIKSEKENTSIIVYLTQMYVFEGLTFTEYVEYDKRLPGVEIPISGEDVVKGKYVQCHKNVLVISLKLNSIENNHIRVMDNFMDVYGFNITYEISSGDVRKDHCNMMDCGFTGICYDYITYFGCHCFPGYSGPSCSQGPKSGCNNSNGTPLCQNGAFCRHIGDSFIKCECPEGFTGEYCNSSTPSEELDTRLVSCMITDRKNQICKCPSGENLSTNDLYAYTGAVQLKAFPIIDGFDVRSFISNQIMENLHTNATTVKNLHIINLESSQTEFGVTFRFYGSKSNENHLRSVINKWGEIGFIGNMTVVNPEIALYKEPIILSIQSVGVVPGRIIHENDNLVLSCSAQGSPNMSFRWYKDGMFVNATRYKNNKWVTLMRGSTLTNYLAILTVDEATVLDGGLFTCQVEDFNIQQCLSKRVEIRSRPVVVLDNMTLTVSKGESFSVKCSSYNGEGTSIYSWTKNGHLLPTKTKRERYDTLYLTGSLLRVSSLNKSANYSCLVQDRTTKSEMSVSVIVVDRRRIKTCLRDFQSDVIWPETAPGYENIQSCPQGYSGFARRICIMLDGDRPQWEMPDMSECVSGNIEKIIKEFEYLRLGYEATSPLQILNRTLNYLNNGIRLLEGEGTVTLKLIVKIISYVNKANFSDNIKRICATAVAVIDKLQLQNQSFTKEEQVTGVQQTVKDLLFLCKRFMLSTDSFHYGGSTILTSIYPINKLTNFRSEITSKRTKTTFELTDVDEHKPYLGSLVNVVYYNLKSFLPSKSILRINDSELDYVIVSDIVATWYIDEKDEIDVHNVSTLNILFKIYGSQQINGRDLSCVRVDFAPFGYYWNKTSCDTNIINETTIKCQCNKFGTFTIIATKDTSQDVEDTIKTPYKVVILMGCSICLLLAVFSALLLIFHWIFHQNCITYLKSQCCCSIIGAMTVFILVQTNNVKNDSYLYINSLLQVFFLTSVSTQLNILLIIYADFLRFKNNRNIKPTSICVITGAPIIIILGNYISHISMNLKLYSWWIVIGSTSFYIFLICCLILMILYITLYCIIIKYIKSKKNISISKDRVVLLRKSLYIFHSIIIVIISSILYINIIENIMCHFVFSITSVTLGFVLLFGYALKFDNVLEQYFLKRISIKSNGDSKKGSITLNHNPTSTKIEKHQDNRIIVTCESSDHTKDQSSASKHIAINVDKQKHLQTIKAPDILNREKCADLDLISSNIQQYLHKTSPLVTNTVDNTETCNTNSNSDNLENELPNLKTQDEIEDCCKVCPECVQENNCECVKNVFKSCTKEVTDSSVQCDENLDAVMCSISNDLDYLLNRTVSTITE